MDRKKSFGIEYIIYFLVLIIPIFDFVLNQSIKQDSSDLLMYFNIVKIAIPVFTYFAAFLMTKRKERLQFFVITLIYILYSITHVLILKEEYKSGKITEVEYNNFANNILNLSIFVINLFVLHKIFFRKNTTRLRMSFNYASAIYLISILLLSLIQNGELNWTTDLPLTLLMLIFIALVSLRYKEDKSYSLILFIALSGYYISIIDHVSGYYATFMIALVYFISIIVEKFVKNRLTIVDVSKIMKRNFHSMLESLKSLNKTRIKRLKSGSIFTADKEIKGISNKRIYKYNDFNRKKVLRSKYPLRRLFINLLTNSRQEKTPGSKEVERRLKLKKKQKRLEKIDRILNSFLMKIIFVSILFAVAIFILYVITNYARTNVNFKFDFKENIKYLIFFIPFIFILIKSFIFIIFSFKKIDSEFIILVLLYLFVLVLSLIENTIILSFPSAIILSAISVVLLNKISIGETARDIALLKEQIDYKEGLDPKRKVVFGISSLAIGGVSRILVDICNGLSKKYPNLDVEIFTLFGKGEFEEGLSIKVNSLFKKHFNSYSDFSKILIKVYLNLFESNIFNKYIKGNYDTVIAFDEGDISSLFSYNDEAKKIAWIHNKNYNIYSKENKKYLNRTARIYKGYDEIIFTREIELRRFTKVFKQKNIRRIPKDVITNYVDPLRIFIKSEEEPVVEWTEKDKVLLSVVRLYKHKAIDRFIKVHKRLLNDGINHKVYIIGDGPEMERLKKLIREEKVQTTVFLLGTKMNPYPNIKECDYFCLFSEKEEYSIVLNEAKILNKNILLTDTTTKDVVQDYPNARIFDNSESGMYTGLRYVLTKTTEDKTNFEYIYKNEGILQQIYCILD